MSTSCMIIFVLLKLEMQLAQLFNLLLLIMTILYKSDCLYPIQMCYQCENRTDLLECRDNKIHPVKPINVTCRGFCFIATFEDMVYRGCTGDTMCIRWALGYRLHIYDLRRRFFTVYCCQSDYCNLNVKEASDTSIIKIDEVYVCVIIILYIFFFY